MILTEARVALFRNIIDSGWVPVDADVTCLVGKNESGKTAFLQALYRLNPVYADGFDLVNEYPRWRASRDRRAQRTSRRPSLLKRSSSWKTPTEKPCELI